MTPRARTPAPRGGLRPAERAQRATNVESRSTGNGRRTAYVNAMTRLSAKPGAKLGPWATIALVGIPLIAILAAAGWYAARAWVEVSGPPMPANGYIAMTLGVIFSVAVGCGLMALLFYSNRHGYDEPFRADGEQSEDSED